MANNRKLIPSLESIAYQVLLTETEVDIRVLHPKIKQKCLQQFLQAVIDDNRQVVTDFLMRHPELLIIEPKFDHQVGEFLIESKLTRQKFYAEKALMMAVKRRQAEMIEILLPFYDNLPQTDEVKNDKANALLAWKSYEVKGLKNSNGIIIPQEYTNLANSLVDVFIEEKFGGDLSDKTKLAILALRRILLPERGSELENSIDAELFLLAAYKALDDRISQLTDRQRIAYCCSVINSAQSILSPETAKVFCEGLFWIDNGRRTVGHTASNLKGRDTIFFYNISRTTGYWDATNGRLVRYTPTQDYELLQKFLITKNNRLSALCSNSWWNSLSSRCSIQ